MTSINSSKYAIDDVTLYDIILYVLYAFDSLDMSISFVSLLIVREQEDLARQHQQESSMTVNGRINVAFARKKRRIDQEIERLLEQIEFKRSQLSDVDARMAEKTRQREEKELQLIEIERQLMRVLLEQQRQCVKRVQDMAGYPEQAQQMLTAIRFPWPPPGASKGEGTNAGLVGKATIKDVEAMVAHWKSEDERN